MSIAVAALIGIAAGSMLGVEATREILNQVVWTLIPVKQFEAEDGLELRHRKIVDEDTYLKIMKQQGYNEAKAKDFYRASHQLLQLGDLIRLKWREEISSETFERRAEQLRLRKIDYELIEKAALYFPSPMELIRMAVREVFTPEVVETFQLDADLPAEFLEHASKVGLSKEIATWTWRAHWVLPSLSMGFEMFHRRVISEEELKLLLRTQDVMPYWRDKLMEISHQTLTRVDVRRMYDLGVLSRRDVFLSYLDLGYSKKNAELMTQFTERYVLGEEKSLTKTQIKKAFKIGEFSMEETVRWLGVLGYPEMTAAFVVALWAHEVLEDYVDSRIDVLSLQVVDGFISIDTFRSELGGLNLPSTRIEKILVDVQHDLLKHQKLPSKADLISFFKGKAIDQSIFREYMLKLGYRTKEIDLYLKNITGEGIT